MKRTLLISLVWLFSSVLPTWAQLKTPSEFLGYELGSQFTYHHRVVDYFEYVAENSDRVVLQQYGQTYERRPLLVAFVTSPSNQAKLESIRQDNLRRAGLASGEMSTNVPIVWLSYNIHGNEANSTEASMVTLYSLATGQAPASSDWLDNTLVVIDPAINPDGRDRYAVWYNQIKGKDFNARPEAREHNEPWPGGRANHYYFDLNRDWAWQTQQESRQRNDLIQQWLPHIHVDFHEQGYNSPYYFAPAAQPMHEDVSAWQRDFQTRIGKNHARYFDSEGWLYFTKEVFDLLYPSYGDSWPTYQGAIGMTYEKAGNGRAGLGIHTETGDTLTLHERLTHHFTTGISTVEMGSKNADEILAQFQKFYDTARNEGAGSYKTYVIKGGNDRDRLKELTQWLDRQKISWGKAGSSRRSEGFSYETNTKTRFRVENDDILISAIQPKGVLVKVLFEPTTALVDSVTYDITAWALPYVYGLEAYATQDKIDVGAAELPAKKAYPTNERPYAYIAEWKSLSDIQYVSALMKAGVKMRFSKVAFKVDGVDFQRGTMVMTRFDNENLGDEFDVIVRREASTFDQPIIGASTGFVQSGADFGSGNMSYVKAPNIAVVAGDAASSLRVGEVWHFFDQQIDYPVTMLHSDDLSRINLNDYDVLILPSGSYGSVMNERLVEKVSSWLREGGKLIAMGSAVSDLARNEKLGSIKSLSTKESQTPTAENVSVYEKRSRDRISQTIVGSIFKVQTDPSHPLNYGVSDRYYTLRDGSTQFELLSSGWNAGLLNEQSHRSGFIGAEIKDHVANTLVHGEESVGRGSIIYIPDNPIFRGFWQVGKIVFANAVFLAGN